MSSLIRDGLFIAALVMFLLGALIGVGWGLVATMGAVGHTNLHVNNPAGLGKVLCVMFATSIGIFRMQEYHNYKSHRRRLRREHRV